ncbi:DUF4112 domain-containing protein [Thalassococcus sp. BH17M4-6]|uniref:DUF4112 domain-containing protein n=1 Tax=Thalassococcus sp. BH17M4-6 TaxID=3413148 RepID=UPI003BC7CA01
MTRHPDFKRVERAEALAHRMDSAFRLPLTRIRLGWDSILGLIPGVGDTLALMPAAYIVWSAHDMGVPLHRKTQMVGNVFIDWLLGLVPLVGDIFDVGFKANRKNAAILRQHIEERHADTSSPGT